VSLHHFPGWFLYTPDPPYVAPIASYSFHMRQLVLVLALGRAEVAARRAGVE
jgi:hypothetical protein